MRLASFPWTLWSARRRKVTAPRFLTYTVTFTCNARCVMCDSWRKPPEDELAVDDVDRIFAQLPRLDGVRLTGGEPFVRKDLTEIAEVAHRRLRPMFLHVTTNGFLTERIIDFVERRPAKLPVHLLVSVDGFGKKHDEVRGHGKAWSMVMDTLTALAPRRADKRIRLSVNQTVVDAEGLEHYRRLRDVLEPLDIRHHVVMAYDASATYSIDKGVDLAPKQIGQFATFGAFTNAQIEELLDEVESDLGSFSLAERIARRYYLRGIRSRLLGDGATPNPRCVALGAHMRLFPNGDVPTCQFNSKTVGNLRAQSFAEVWSAAAIQEQRDWVAKCPGCWAECEVLPSAIYTGDLARAVLPARRERAADRAAAVAAADVVG